MKHGGDITVIWACFAASGAAIIDGAMNAGFYKHILQEMLMDPTAVQEKYSGPGLLKHLNSCLGTLKLNRNSQVKQREVN